LGLVSGRGWAGLRGAGERQEIGWGGGLILSKAQKSATAPAHLLLASAAFKQAKSPNAVAIACRNGLMDSTRRRLGSGCGVVMRRCCQAVRLSSPTLLGVGQPLLVLPQRYSALRRRTSCQTPSPATRLPSSSSAGQGSSGTGTGAAATTAATHWKVWVCELTFMLDVPTSTLRHLPDTVSAGSDI